MFGRIVSDKDEEMTYSVEVKALAFFSLIISSIFLFRSAIWRSIANGSEIC